jgi:hypothetical protein
MKLFFSLFTKASERCKLFKCGNKVYFKVEEGAKQEYIVLKTSGDSVVVSHKGRKRIVHSEEIMIQEEYREEQGKSIDDFLNSRWNNRG